MEIVLIVIAVVLLILVLMYNSLVRKRNMVDQVFASMDAMLKKRFDLIPNLVSSVKEYMKHEAGTLTKITELRTKALSPNISTEDKVVVNNELNKLLGGLKVAFENYPDLKASNNFLQLQASLNEVEEQISAARRTYNAAVNDNNNAVDMFPTNIIAGLFGFKRRTLFEIPESERANINVGNLFNS
ncbi:MAG TPA: LemA family protein [Ignavibacteriaceae bacterium]|mgnify:CR=1 FL=1|jgi:LemA protein|nr:LemA family protein [Ignavibacteriaceae bacterium]HOJ18554.1 LemA family protein [Ignavibacteriaceae bacterium]HPO55491.1 LemA family protein [Ignavibacteriaceae bacterium]